MKDERRDRFFNSDNTLARNSGIYLMPFAGVCLLEVAGMSWYLFQICRGP